MAIEKSLLELTASDIEREIVDKLWKNEGLWPDFLEDSWENEGGLVPQDADAWFAQHDLKIQELKTEIVAKVDEFLTDKATTRYSYNSDGMPREGVVPTTERREPMSSRWPDDDNRYEPVTEVPEEWVDDDTYEPPYNVEVWKKAWISPFPIPTAKIGPDPKMNGWDLDKIDRKSEIYEVSRIPKKKGPRMKAMEIPILYAEEVCKMGQGKGQCRYLDTGSSAVHEYPRLFCRNNTLASVTINREVNEFLSLRGYVPEKPTDRDFPLGDHCPGIQKMPPTIVETYKRPRMPIEISDLTVLEFENILIDCLRKANEHVIGVEANHALHGHHLTSKERVGMFCTSIRSQLSNNSDKLRDDKTRQFTTAMTKPETWCSVLNPYNRTYDYHYGTIRFANGEWTLNHAKLTELSTAAQTGYRFVPEEVTLQAECNASLLLVEKSLPTLNALVDQAHRINVESDLVIANIVQIAESLER